MNGKLYTDSFERLLREKSDEFRMYPASRVWHSIYNNIYPGRRWPSVIMAIVLLSTLPLIGFLNTKDHSSLTQKNATGNAFIAKAIVPPFKIAGPAIAARINNKAVAYAGSVVMNNKILIAQNIPHLSITHEMKGFHVNAFFDKKNFTVLPAKYILTNNTSPAISDQSQSNITDKNDNPSGKDGLNANTISTDKQPAQRWTDKLALQIYASPSIVYGIVAGPQLNSSSAASQDINSINQNIGLEAGTAMQYSLSKALKVKAGLQFNYASYDVAAFQSDHSLANAAPLSLNDIAPAATSLYPSNGVSAVTLHNETYQFSLPVGLELKLLKSHNLQWNAGATIQPTFIAGGNAYLLSSTHNYIDESSLINRWNLNAGLETFLTYKINGVTWQLGPQFRYQFSPTYGKSYSAIDEKVAIFGVKIGVTKVLH